MNIPGGDHYQKATRRSVGKLATASLAAFLITRRHQRGGGDALKPLLECGGEGGGAHTSLHPVTEGKYIQLCSGGSWRRGGGGVQQQAFQKKRDLDVGKLRKFLIIVDV